MMLTLGKTTQYFCNLRFVWIASLIWLSVLVPNEVRKQKQTAAPKKGRLQAQSQAIVHYAIPRWVYLITTQFVNSRQGSHGPLQTRPSIQAQSKTLSPSATLMSLFFNLSLPISSNIFYINNLLINLSRTIYLKILY
jgi:hypothetical protein